VVSVSITLYDLDQDLKTQYFSKSTITKMLQDGAIVTIEH